MGTPLIEVDENGRLKCVNYLPSGGIHLCGGTLTPKRNDRFLFLECDTCHNEIHTTAHRADVTLIIRRYNI